MIWMAETIYLAGVVIIAHVCASVPQELVAGRSGYPISRAQAEIIFGACVVVWPLTLAIGALLKGRRG